MMATSLNYNRKRQRLLSNCSSNSNNTRPILLSKKQHYSDSINNEIINLDSDDDDYIFNNENNNLNNNNNNNNNDDDLDFDFDFVMNDDNLYNNNLLLDNNNNNNNESIDSNNNNNNNNSLSYNLNYNFNNSESAVEDTDDDDNDDDNINKSNNEEEEDDDNEFGNDNLDNGQSYSEYFQKNHSKYTTRHLSFTTPINNFVNKLFKRSNNLPNSNQSLSSSSSSSSSLNSNNNNNNNYNNKKKRTKSLPQLAYAKLTYSPALDLNEVNLKIGDVKASLINHQNLNYTYNTNINFNNNNNNINNRNLNNLRKFSFNQHINHKSSTSSNPSFSSTSKSSATSSYDDKYLSNSKNDMQYIYNNNNNNNNDNDNQIEEINCDDDDGHYIVKNGAPFANGRFIIKKLLGQGTFGKVVKAYDNKTNSFVAIKIIKSIHKYREASKIELRVLTMLKKHDPNNKFQCIHLRECFDYRNHICIVTDLLKISIYDFMDKNQFLPFPGSHIQAISKQLLRSVAFLHDLNLIHTDLKPENILIKDSTYFKKPFKKLSNNNDKDDKIYLRKILKDPKIYTIDFGSAIFQDEYHSSIISTRHYRAPEIILGIGWSFPCDIWSIGCVLIELLIGDALFKTHDNEQHLAMMEKVINKPIDLKMVRQCLLLHKSNFKNNSNYNNNRFDATIVNSFSKKNGKLKFPNSSTDQKLIQEVEQLNSIEKIVEEKIGFKFNLNMSVKDSISFFKINSKQIDDYIFWYYYIDLIKKMLVFDPNKRITARDALNHKWFSIGILDDGI